MEVIIYGKESKADGPMPTGVIEGDLKKTNEARGPRTERSK